MNRHECMAVYIQKLQLVCDYIQRHLDEDLDVDRLSQIAALSKFHFLSYFCHSYWLKCDEVYSTFSFKAGLFSIGF